MSVIIKGMDMPKNCCDCDFEAYPRGAHYCQLEMRVIESLDRPNWCPLEEADPIHRNPEDAYREDGKESENG